MEIEIRSVTFKAKEAAKYMGIPYGTILTMARRQIDRLPHIKIGSKFIFRKDALDNWMMEHDGVKTDVIGYDFSINVSGNNILCKIIFNMVDDELTKRKLTEREKETVFLNLMEVIKNKYLMKLRR